MVILKVFSPGDILVLSRKKLIVLFVCFFFFTLVFILSIEMIYFCPGLLFPSTIHLVKTSPTVSVFTCSYDTYPTAYGHSQPQTFIRVQAFTWCVRYFLVLTSFAIYMHLSLNTYNLDIKENKMHNCTPVFTLNYVFSLMNTMSLHNDFKVWNWTISWNHGRLRIP